VYPVEFVKSVCVCVCVIMEHIDASIVWRGEQFVRMLNVVVCLFLRLKEGVGMYVLLFVCACVCLCR